MNRDVLGEIFKFLDFSNVIPVALVCREWSEVMHSENLWKVYFNSFCYSKDQLLLESQCKDIKNYWKNQIMERCSAFCCKLPARRFIGSQKLNLSLSHSYFPSSDSNYFSCFFKVLCSRIEIESAKLISLSGEEGLSVPFLSESFNFSQTLNFKIRLKIEGLSELLIARVYNVPKYSKGSISRNYFMYFALESDDLSNLQYLTPPMVKLNQVKSLKRSFLFEFIKKDRFGSITGQEYLIERILSQIFPPHLLKSEIEKQEMASMWCLIIGRILSLLDASRLTDHKEVWKFIPFTKSKQNEESLVYAFRRGIYRERAKIIAHRVLPNDKYVKFMKGRESDSFASFEELKMQKVEIISMEHRKVVMAKSLDYSNSGALGNVSINKEILKQIKLMALSDEFMKYYLDYKFSRIKE
ncbi:hypothetical protein NAEGRDRAFT_80933 [Naegleria gruberi]|uniref:F-box domain-containing protein n=1 Tax=Naegleria gruberi TaxID=5762 RepID=D2VR36_NAEGR|nr:uncharacterized protein NAEGRDRAFT_80933 [Naegleria gruberi]EFC40738.1 hypothetical protein NAEGRDRAFT_80933 [Naegleria gruberi]|eukprot:XP_002673482.1 hypothetical protein NAEGRDRAFT_80933 [Naegleria gruberi strain NEG-M]